MSSGDRLAVLDQICVVRAYLRRIGCFFRRMKSTVNSEWKTTSKHAIIAEME